MTPDRVERRFQDAADLLEKAGFGVKLTKEVVSKTQNLDGSWFRARVRIPQGDDAGQARGPRRGEERTGGDVYAFFKAKTCGTQAPVVWPWSAPQDVYPKAKWITVFIPHLRWCVHAPPQVILPKEDTAHPIIGQSFSTHRQSGVGR